MPEPEDARGQELSPESQDSTAQLIADGGDRLASILVRLQASSGPLPPPEILHQYGLVVPNGAERLFQTYETQLAHRIDMERRLVVTNTRLQTAGFCAAFLLASLTIAGGFLLALRGYSLFGMAAVITAIGGLAGVFIIGRREQTRERIQKDAELRKHESGR